MLFKAHGYALGDEVLPGNGSADPFGRYWVPQLRRRRWSLSWGRLLLGDRWRSGLRWRPMRLWATGEMLKAERVLFKVLARRGRAAVLICTNS